MIPLLFSLIAGRDQWTPQQAWAWRNATPFLLGNNFIPSTAVNVLEMWQNQTFDLQTIQKQLGIASFLGYRLVRVFLHPLVWNQNRSAFKQRLQLFLSTASAKSILTMPVLFDDCWKPEPVLGRQPEPIPRTHNSQWVQSPGAEQHVNSGLFGLYREYFLDIIGTHKDDKRVYLWDIYNQPGNSGFINRSLPLLRNAFSWARQANPSQPISAGLWNFGASFKQLNDFQLMNSDVTTFHIYANAQDTLLITKGMIASGRPVICTQYMARQLKSLISTHVPLFYQLKVPAVNWGLVKGRTNTIYPWWWKPQDGEPQVWFHDITDKEGRAFDEQEKRTLQDYGRRSQV